MHHQRSSAAIIFIFANLLTKINADPIQCSNTQTFCPPNGECCHATYSPTSFGCQLQSQIPFVQQHYIRSEDTFYGDKEPPHPTQSCCMPGPALEPSTTKPNTLILGDSVSIGYTGYVSRALANLTLLQHSPYDVRDGGAGATNVGVACLDNFLKTQRQTAVQWDIVMFNFGLHDLDNHTSAEETYEQQLLNITNRLVQTGSKLMYALTTPYMPLTRIGNTVVADLNRIASKIMISKGIKILNLHKVITQHCGDVYTSCDWCRKNPCSYHYNNEGYTALGKAVASAFREILSEEQMLKLL